MRPRSEETFPFGSLSVFSSDDVISGTGTYVHGGRFVPPGVRAVYASIDKETALREVTARKKTLAGRKQLRSANIPG